MLPKPPPREAAPGFLFLPPYRVQGISIAGEQVTIQVPELDLGFDIGSCPRSALPSKHLAISHGHMDHIGALAYFCSQRRFQGMGTATLVCDKRIAPDIHALMEGVSRLERQRTPYEIIALEEDERLEIKNNLYLQGFAVEHTAPSFAFTIIERRTKLLEELVGLPQEKLRELKARGQEITRELFIPLLTYIADTEPGAHLIRPEVLQSRIVICECTFFDAEHRSRARIGKHMHVEDIAEWLGVLEAEHLVLHHISRRTHMASARARLQELLSDEQMARVHLLMDHRANKARYEAQLAEAQRSQQPQH